jgi:hypothetical protein
VQSNSDQARAVLDARQRVSVSIPVADGESDELKVPTELLQRLGPNAVRRFRLDWHHRNLE